MQSRELIWLSDRNILEGAYSGKISSLFRTPTTSEGLADIFHFCCAMHQKLVKFVIMDEFRCTSCRNGNILGIVIHQESSAPRGRTWADCLCGRPCGGSWRKGRLLIVDRMNYNHATVCWKYGLDSKLTDNFFHLTSRELASACRGLGIECRVVCWEEDYFSLYTSF